MANRIQLRRGTSAEWAASNPVLAQGEPGIEKDTGKQKFGDGTTVWSLLPYASVGPQGLQGPAGVANDSSVANLVTASSSTRTALDSRYVNAGELMINPKDYGAVGNATADDTTAVQAAVTAAFTTGAVMFWPNGGYKTTTNITNLHNVKHRGNGYLVRGGINFFLDPASNRSNTLHVSPSGVSTNDGLSPSEPRDVQSALDALSNYGPVLGGQWTIQHAAGTYTGGYGFPRILSRAKIKFQGPAMGGPRITPTCVYDRAGAAIDWGVYTVDRAQVSFSDIKFVGYNRTVINSGGIRVGEYNSVDLWNIHTDTCELGFFAMDHVVYNYGGSYFLNSSYAAIHELYMTLRNSTALVDADRTILQGGKFGIKSKELNTGHADRTEFLDFTEAAIHLSRSSTMNFSYSTFKRNANCVIVAGSSAFVDLYTVFGTGADKNTVKYRYLAGASNVSLAATENAISAPYIGMTEKSLAYGRMPGKHTGTLTDTNIVPLGTINAGDLQGEGAWIKWEAYGSANITVAATLRIRAAGLAVAVITMPTGVYNFKFEGRMYVTATGDTQRADSGFYWSGGAPLFGGGNRTIAFSTTTAAMGIFAALGATADSVQIDQAYMLTSDL
ncbi:glycosyl hydrolase family 28-related protein [Paenarthrobacter ilicis]|uniref:hyaluronate lyase N-terminal domain-containing protein n=1 Tax=Paenarthrobacter ilicis TaxID=43665 RepID=UPI0028D0D039|nr:glycosyl hydrolase family 28-related protein [Paenarthrobacter ilicis]